MDHEAVRVKDVFRSCSQMDTLFNSGVTVTITQRNIHTHADNRNNLEKHTHLTEQNAKLHKTGKLLSMLCSSKMNVPNQE